MKINKKDHISIIQINIPRTWTRHLLNRLLEYLNFSVWMLMWGVLLQKAHFEQRFENINNPRITFYIQYSIQNRKSGGGIERENVCASFFLFLCITWVNITCFFRIFITKMYKEDANANPKLIHWLQFKTIPHLTLAHRSHCRECALLVWEDGFPWGETLRCELLYPKTLSHPVLGTCSTSETHKHAVAAGEDAAHLTSVIRHKTNTHSHESCYYV